MYVRWRGYGMAIGLLAAALLEGAQISIVDHVLAQMAVCAGAGLVAGEVAARVKSGRPIVQVSLLVLVLAAAILPPVIAWTYLEWKKASARPEPPEAFTIQEILGEDVP